MHNSLLGINVVSQSCLAELEVRSGLGNRVVDKWEFGNLILSRYLELLLAQCGNIHRVWVALIPYLLGI